MNWIPLLFFCTVFCSTVYSATAHKKGSRLRDPFSLGTYKKELAKSAITLEGIVDGGNFHGAAILACGDKREVVVRGETFEGYTVTVIGKNFVTLAKGKEKQKLIIE
jgi:hypothetical protein